MDLLSSILKKTLNVIAPARCIHCDEYSAERTLLCSKCIESIHSTDVPFLLTYEKGKSVRVHSYGIYHGPLADLVRAKNYKRRAASRLIGSLLEKKYHTLANSCDYIVPVALHWSRYAWRGFNQAHEIASSLAGDDKKKVAFALKRKRKHYFQMCSAKQEKDASNIFSIKNEWHEKLFNKHIILVDDVCKSGQTIIQAVRACQVAKPASIRVLVGAWIVDSPIA